MSEYIAKCNEVVGISGKTLIVPDYIDTSKEIMRCGDCDFSHEDELGNLRCHGPLTEPWDYYNDEPSDGVKVEPDGFCAWAERKEGGDGLSD